MWNLNGDDIQRVKEELKGRRAAIRARYESEMKQLDTDIADLEAFERFAVKLASDFKGEEGPSATVADPELAVENVVAEIVSEQSGLASPDAAAMPSAEAEPAPNSEPAGAQKSTSRWRMRLNAGEVSP